jgi:GDP-D-mannose dehydratase
MLQIDLPEYFVIATDESNSPQDFVASTFLQIVLDWSDHVIQDLDPFHPLEIRYKCGNANKAKSMLGCSAKMKMRNVIGEMIRYELQSSEVKWWANYICRE